MTQQPKETNAMTQPGTYHVPRQTRVVACRLDRDVQQQFHATVQQQGTNVNSVLAVLVQEYIRKQQEAK